MSESNWVYVKSEPMLWTVGFYDPEGKWQSDSDHDVREDAVDRVRYLNGGLVTVEDEDLKDKKGSPDQVTVKMDFQDDDVKFSEEVEIDIPKAYQVSGRQAHTFALLEMMNMMPENMNPETAKSIGLKEIDLPKSPDITITSNGKSIQLDLVQFTTVANAVSKMLDMLEKADVAVESIRRYSGRS